MAGLVPHTAEYSRLRLAAEPAEPPLPDERRSAGELRQQTTHAQEPAGGAAAGEPQDGAEITDVPRSEKRLLFVLRLHSFK